MSHSAVVWGAIALAGVAVAAGSLVVAHMKPTGLSPVRDPVSAYGISAYRAWYRAAVVATGVAGAAEAIGISSALRGVRLVVACLWVFAAARVLIGWFPMDREDAPRTTAGRVHWILAVVAFAAVTVAGLRLRSTLARNGLWPGAYGTLSVLAWCMFVAALAALFIRGTSQVAKYFGAAERVFYVTMLAWLAAVGAALL
jgi:Protein of unknown function (DUF998)